MPSHSNALDVTGVPQLVELVNQVRTSGEPRVLRIDNEDVAVVVPLRRRSARRSSKATPSADDAAIAAAFGSWRGLVDAEALKQRLKDERGSARPPVVL